MPNDRRQSREGLTKGIRRALLCCLNGKSLFSTGDPPLYMVKRAAAMGLLDTETRAGSPFVQYRTNEAGRAVLQEEGPALPSVPGQKGR